MPVGLQQAVQQRRKGAAGLRDQAVPVLLVFGLLLCGVVAGIVARIGERTGLVRWPALPDVKLQQRLAQGHGGTQPMFFIGGDFAEKVHPGVALVKAGEVTPGHDVEQRVEHPAQGGNLAQLIEQGDDVFLLGVENTLALVLHHCARNGGRVHRQRVLARQGISLFDGQKLQQLCALVGLFQTFLYGLKQVGPAVEQLQAAIGREEHGSCLVRRRAHDEGAGQHYRRFAADSHQQPFHLHWVTARFLVLARRVRGVIQRQQPIQVLDRKPQGALAL